MSECDRLVRIPMRDGVELGATLLLPDTGGPAPAVLALAPYRKDDFNAGHESWPPQYFAQHGYASLEVDMRGCGTSNGVSVPFWTRTLSDTFIEHPAPHEAPVQASQGAAR